jgi:hypothetical protein
MRPRLCTAVLIRTRFILLMGRFGRAASGPSRSDRRLSNKRRARQSARRPRVGVMALAVTGDLRHAQTLLPHLIFALAVMALLLATGHTHAAPRRCGGGVPDGGE